VDGRVILAGAPVASVASGYEVVVSKFGYNSAQTYPSGAENPYPTPAHAGVLQNQTTAVTFGLPDSGIDLVSTKTVYTFSAITSGTWNEPFAGTSQVESVAIGHQYLARWREFSWSGSTPAGTAAVFRFFDAGGTLIPDADLPGNTAGFTSSVDLYALSTSTHPTIVVRATLITGDPDATPSVDSYAVVYDYGPVPLGNARFDMRGTKRIGTDPTIYKYDEAGLETNASGMLAFPDMEWDTYDITIPVAGGYDLAYACSRQPEYLAPGSAQTTLLFLAPHTSNALRVAVESDSGAAVTGATVVLSRLGSYATSTTSSCGQIFFPSLAADTYGYLVTAGGYANKSGTTPVSGFTEQIVELTPQ